MDDKRGENKRKLNNVEKSFPKQELRWCVKSNDKHTNTTSIKKKEISHSHNNIKTNL
jgi:hypothetical protein